MLAELLRMQEQLDTVAQSLEQTWRAKESVQGELETTRTRHEAELERERLRGELIEAEARADGARIIAAAEEQAARIHTEDGRRVAEAAGRLEHLLRVREQVLGELRGIVQAYSSLLEKVQHEPLDAVLAEEEGALVSVLSPTPGSDERVTGRGDLFPRRVELDAGPFADFGELSAFERSLSRLPKVEDVHVRHFGDDRAEIELTLTEERPLVDDLTRHLPFPVDVMADDDRLQVDLRAPAEAAMG